jgi:hypothetical protein
VRRLAAWGTAQRIVVVIGLAVALLLLGRYLVQVGQPRNFGWFAYAPLNTAESGSYSSTVAISHHGIRPWLRLLIWLGLVAVWTGAAFAIFHRRKANGPPLDSRPAS